MVGTWGLAESLFLRRPHKVLHDKAVEPIEPDTLYKNTNGCSIRVYQLFAAF